ncbi:MAG: SDR family oxidoreductase [Lachnospiraceae bacterium]|nr:SDR family oxidoreductase [Lachnospiraceae bacterium]
MKQVVVMTGAGGGLGSTFAKEFAKKGKQVAVLDFNLEAAEKTVEEIRKAGGTAIAVKCNVTDKASLEKARETVRKELGKCNVLINCAGIQDPLAKTTKEAYCKDDEKETVVAKPKDGTKEAYDEILAKDRTLFNIDAERLLKVMNVNWLGTVMTCQVFAVDMVGTEGNSIINITSMAAYDALTMVPAYASSKAAVDMFTRWLSNYLSNEYGKVRVNAVAPGYFLTPLNHDMYVNSDGTYTQRYYNVIHRTPMGRLGDTKELVGALLFFAEPEMSGYITGQVIAVDGGFLSCPGI